MKRVFIVQYYGGNDFLFKLVEVKRESYAECLVAIRNWASVNDTSHRDTPGAVNFDIQSVMELSPTFEEDVMGSYFIHHGRVVDLHDAHIEREVLT